MTEQEAIKYLKDANRNNQMVGILPKSDIGKCLVNTLEEVEQYRAIGTPDECRAAVEKQTAKKPIEPDEEYGTFKCPNCGGLIFTENRFETHKHCLLCGQKLDWSGEDDD